ncbi:MAG: gliding motility-associated C-terminal domain-containing protein [Cyclobacteriaceae bacterium]|nr:gliding motility-associated C-terminal domain-containing protein [Cyclobacteriaceae bacterium]
MIPGSGTAAAIGAPLAAGNYFVQAINATTNCKSPITTFAINDTHVIPAVTLFASVSNTNCSVTPNGSITIEINGGADPVTDFTIDWFEGNGTTTPLGTTVGTTGGVNNEIAQAISGGTYTVRVRDNITPNAGCAFTTSFAITDNPVFPVPTGTPAANTACDPAKSNGSVVADVGGTTVGYTFHIFRGQNTLLANEVTSGPATAANLEAGVYTVQAIIDASGCAATTEVTVGNNIVLPTIDATSATDVTSCSVPDGSVSVTAVSIGALADYTFSWFDGNGLKAVPDYTGSTVTGLLAGNYTVIATNNVLGCDVQMPVTVTVNNDPSTLITINELLAERIIPAVCTDGLGQIGADASSPANAGGGFTFSWYSGDKNTGLSFEGNGVDFFFNSNRISSAASGEPIFSGLHTVIALDNTTGCRDSLVIHLPYSDEAALLSILTTPQTDCLNPDGGFDATITPSAGTIAAFPLIDQSWYELRVYQNGVLLSNIPGVEPAPTTVSGLAAGNYTILAVETHPSLSGCSSAPNDINIGDNRNYPLITPNVLTDNKNCVGSGTDTGSISLTVDGVPTPGVGYIYTWYDGKLNTDPILGAANVPAPGHSAINIDGGFYTVEVTSALNNCKAEETLYLNNSPYVISIASTDLAITPQSDCNPDNGSATVLDVLIDGASSGGVGGYTFEWFLNDGTTTIPLSSTNAIVGTPIGADNYFVKATNIVSNCISPLRQFTINDVSVPPAITQNSLVDNTNCAGAAANGSITIDVDGGAPAITDFAIQWYTGVGTASPIGGATTATISNLGAGDYTVEVTDILSPGNTCSSIATFSIVDDLPVVTIAGGAITLTDQTDCVANGGAQVTDILIDGISNGGTGGFTFEWFDDSGATIDGPLAAATVGLALASGNYRVVATNTASACTSLVTPFTINDVSVPPAITQNSLVDNTNCAGAAANGSITIDVDGGAPAITDFAIQWYTGVGTASPIGGATTATISNLGAGDYTVEVTDILSPSNTCSSVAVFSIIDAPNNIGLNISDIIITDNSDCLPMNGSATVTDVIFNGNPVGNTIGYTFEWLRSDLTIVDPGNGPTVGVVLPANNYYVRATHVASNCTSSNTPFTIKDATTIPVVVANTDLDNFACNTSYTGQVSASVSEGLTNGITAGYTFDWFSGKNNTNVADFINSGAILSGLQDGDYTVRVTDTSTPSANCESIASVLIKRDVPIVNGTLTANAQTVCAPIQDGNIAVNSIQQFLGGITNSFDMNNAADRNMFSFQWFDANLAAVSPIINGNPASPNLEEGTFYVQISDALGCTSDYIKGVIDDQTTSPLIALDEFINPAVCILPELKGSLIVSADNNSSFANYTFEWFEGNTPGGTLVEPNSSFLGNIDYTDILEYTVRVTNNATQCFSLETYQFKTDTVDIQVVASAVPLTSCVTDNGSLFAATRTGSGQLYNIEWYIGGVVGTTPDFTSNEVLIAPIGLYTAIAKHPTLSFCNSIPDTISVTDGRFYPTVTATQKAPLTYCDPGNPNGVAFATVNGSVVGYAFDWYEGSVTGNPVYTGSEAGILRAIMYAVKATDIISGCTDTTSITIENDPFAVPLPEITLISNRTDCVVLDGALSVDVNGLTKDHIFNWYIGNAVKNQVDAVGEMYTDIDAGIYTVTATDRISGCTSGGIQKEVLAVMLYPDFNVKTVDTNCDEDIGSAALVELGGVDVKQIEWNILGAIEVGPQVSALPSGVFSVTAISFKDCETSKTFEIKTDITIYNGISRNNDGLNDFFEIGCISEFPNNLVRIYNRAGTLVYEAGGYNNQDVYFNGISNRGVSILGNDLPDGTYFYIITKGDGSETKTGYLELLH